MARIPDNYTLSGPESLRSGRAIATYDTTAIGRGIQAIGGALSQIGEEKKAQENAVDVARAEAEKTKGLLDTQNQFENDPDYATFDKRGAPKVDGTINNAGKLIRDPKMRERWLATQQEAGVRAKDWLIDQATNKRRSAEVVALDEANKTNYNLVIDPNTPDDIRAKAQQDIDANIKVNEETGLLSPEEASKRRELFVQNAYDQRALLAAEAGQLDLPDRSLIGQPMSANVSERATRAMEYFQSRGWTKEQASGIVGNLLAESKLRVDANNAGDGSDGSDSIGVAQWNSDRAQRLKDFAALNKVDWRDYGIQLAFVDHELRTTEKKAGDMLGAAGDVQSATDAMIMYERPAGSDKGARNAHNYEGRLRSAYQAAGKTVPDYFDKVSPQMRARVYDISTARQRELYNQQIAQQKIIQQGAKDDYSLQIATNPARVTQADILGDTRLDNGDKAALINTHNAALKENQGVNQFIDGFSTGDKVSVNPFDKDQTKIADKAYDQMLNSADEDKRPLVTSSFISQTGYVPEKIQAEIRRGMASTSVPEMTTVLQTIDSIDRIAPTSIKAMTGHEQVQKSLLAFRHFTQDMGYKPEEAARKVISLNDPEMATRRDAIMKSKPVADTLKAVDANTVTAQFNSITSFSKSLGDVPDQQELSVGYTPESEAAIVEDYRSMFEEGIADAGGDLELGKKMADERFQRLYGTSELMLAGTRAVVKLPPEKVYPPDANGSHAYIREQAIADLKDEGIDASEVFLQPYDQTERDVSAGNPANYQVFFMRNGKLEKLPNPFIADPVKANEDAIKQHSETQKKNLSGAIEEDKTAQAIRAAREAVDVEYKDYPETFRAVKKREAERAIMDEGAN